MAHKIGFPGSCALHIVHGLGTREWQTPTRQSIGDIVVYDPNPDDIQPSIIVTATYQHSETFIKGIVAQGYKPLKTWRNYAQGHHGNLCTLWMRVPPASIASEGEQFTIPVPPLPATAKKEGHK